jgi:hypothetical protein
VRRLERCLLCELSDALCDGEYARYLLGRQLELANRSRQQALACRIQRVGRSWPAACLPCACNHVLIRLATPTAPVGHVLFGATLGGFDHQFSRERYLEGWPPLSGGDRFGCAATGERGVAGVPTDAGRCDIGGHAVLAADAAEGERISQRSAAAQKRDRMVAGQRHTDGAAQVLLAGNGVQTAAWCR